jgi:hypothetical protein
MANLNGLINGIITGMIIHAQDESGSGGYNYYGYLSGDGKIIIMRVSTDETLYRYYLSTETVDGTARTFESEWAARASKTYNKITLL